MFSDRKFTVYDMETMDVVATMDNSRIYAHGSMAISTGHAGKVYAYIVPYVESADLLVVEHDLRSNSLSLKTMSDVAMRQYCSQQVHFMEDGSIIYTNDGGKLYCIRHNVAVSGLTMSDRTKTIGVGEEFRLEVSFSPSNAGIRTLEWSTSDPDVATVKDGLVTGTSFGSAVITATSANGKSATCTVTVGSPTVHVSSVTLDRTTASMVVGETLVLTATVSPSNATDRSVTWSSSNTKVATVDGGVVRCLAEGTAVITATTTDGGYTATCDLTLASATFTITWKDWDGSVLATARVDKGVVPSYDGVPTRASDPRYVYTFSGWSPEPAAATQDATYTAQYDAAAKIYNIIYLPGDHGAFQAQTYAATYGSLTPSFSGTPEGETGYSFISWSPAVSSTVTGDATYAARWTATEHSVRYLLDGTLFSEQKHMAGSTVKVLDRHVRTGYEVSDWSTADVPVDDGMFVMPAKDVIFTATSTIETFSITWKNWDGSVLLMSEADYGTVPAYDKAAPSRASDGTNSYSFSGWSPSPAPAAADTTYTAMYRATTLSYTVKYLVDGAQIGDVESHKVGEAVKLRDAYSKEGYEVGAWQTAQAMEIVDGAFAMPAYDIVFTATSAVIVLEATWKNWDGTALATSEADYGTAPSYNGPMPTRPADSGYTYSFSGWSPDVGPITSDAVYTAVFDSIPVVAKTYRIVWKNWDGTALGTSVVEEGSTPSYGGTAPVRESDGAHSYSFSGWSPEPVPATADAVYTATYDETVLEHYVRYYVDGDQVGDVESHKVGEAVKLRDSYSKEGYEVGAWQTAQAVEIVDGAFAMPAYDVTFSASSNPLRFSIVWKNWDESVLEKSESEYGTVPAYSGPMPAREADAEYTYSFAGWDPLPAAATSDATYTATFDRIPVVAKTYNITWIDWDESVLQTSVVEEGSVPRFNGPLPVREPDAEYTYSFSGWSPEPVAAFADATYAATFDRTPVVAKTYTITWMDYDGSVLRTSSMEEGAVPAYDGTPSRGSDGSHSYVFSGWSPEPVPATADAVYTATYRATAISYTVKYLVDGTQVGDVESHEVGKAVKLRDAYAKEGYVVSAWQAAQAVEIVDGAFAMPAYDLTFSASSTPVQFRIVWKDWDDSVLAEASAPYGSMPSYPGSAPSRPSDSEFSYSFSGWSPSIVPAKSDATYTATYKATPIVVKTYTITWKNLDGSVLSTSTVREGTVPTYDGPMPVKEPDGRYSYVHSGWSPVPTAATSDATYKTTYRAIPLGYAVKYMLDGMQVGETENHAAGETVKLRDKCVKEGYEVGAWQTAQAVRFVDGGFVMPAYDVTFTSISKILEFGIVWKNWDGSVLAESSAVYGSTPIYSGSAPARPADSHYSYTFSGWSPSVGPVTADMAYTAVFDAVPVVMDMFRITWKNWDGSVLSTSDVRKGAVPSYGGSAPERPSDSHYSYTFSGWEPAPVAAVADATYTAAYESSPMVYSVRYVVDGVQVGEAEQHAFGDAVKLRAIYEKEGYEVSGWTSEKTVYFVNGAFLMPAYDVTFSATSTPSVFDITWKNWDGSVLGTSTAGYGAIPEYSGSTPAKPSDGAYDYIFSGWDPTPAAAKSDATYTARYEAVAVDKHVTGVELDRTSVSMSIGDTVRLAAAVKPSDASDRSVVWTSSDVSVAKVDQDGNVTAVANGTAKITAKTVDGGYTADCAVTVGSGSGSASDDQMLWILGGLAGVIVVGAGAAVLMHRRKVL